MQLQARLVHAEPGRRVVEVSAHREGALLGSALGEGSTAEEAEDRALVRLRGRLADTTPAAPTPSSSAPTRRPAAPEPVTRPPQPAEPEQPTAAPIQEPPPDPEDWSGELAQIDLQLKRLGWQRDQESTYLKRAFGHPSRSRLTTYGDLLAYLQALQTLEPDTDPAVASVPLRRCDLLAQCDALMVQLQWDATKGREFLEGRFQVSSRQQLSDAQLLQFNMLLEGELIGV